MSASAAAQTGSSGPFRAHEKTQSSANSETELVISLAGTRHSSVMALCADLP